MLFAASFMPQRERWRGQGAGRPGGTRDLALERLHLLVVERRVKQSEAAAINDVSGSAVAHTPEFIGTLLDEELGTPLSRAPGADGATANLYREARGHTKESILRGYTSPP